MFGENILIVVDSVLELIFSIQVRRSILAKCEVDIIVTNQSNHAYRFAENLKKQNVFSNVYFAYSSNFPHHYYSAQNKEELSIAEYFNIVESIIANKRYDSFITSELDIFSRTVYAYLKSENQNIIPFFLAESLHAYAEHGPITIGIERRIKAKDTLFRDFLLDIQGIIVNNAQKCKENFKYVIEYPPIDINDLEMIEILNAVFNYEKGECKIRKKIVYFEEALVFDGSFSNDVDIVDTIVKNVGKENVIIKKHPREQGNRFQHLEVECYKRNDIPWELVVLNRDVENCLLVTNNSGSVYHPVFFGWYQSEVVMLCDICECEIKESLRTIMDSYYNYLRQEIYRDKLFFVPNNVSEFIIKMQEFCRVNEMLEGEDTNGELGSRE